MASPNCLLLHNKGVYLKNILTVFFTCILLIFFLNLNVFAHTLYMSVDDNEDGTVTVIGMFSTGSIGSNIEVRLENEQGEVIWKGKTDNVGECTFEKPNIPYTIIMDFGPGVGHQAKESGPI